MKQAARKMSEMMKGMSERLLRHPDAAHSSEAAHVVLIFANNIRVEWLPPVAPGVDSKWEMRLYGLVRTGEREQAIDHLRETRRISRTEAVKQVKKIASDLGMA